MEVSLKKRNSLIALPENIIRYCVSGSDSDYIAFGFLQVMAWVLHRR